MDADEPPDELQCPITYSLFRDPVVCVADGRVYEQSALISYWKRRPLASFFGGPLHKTAAMMPALAMQRGGPNLAPRESTPCPGWLGLS